MHFHRNTSASTPFGNWTSQLIKAASKLVAALTVYFEIDLFIKNYATGGLSPKLRLRAIGVALTALLLSKVGASANDAQHPSVGAAKHRALAFTQAAEAILRDDGRVVAFADEEEHSKPVLIQGLQDIVDVSGHSWGFTLGANEAAWIALHRDGTVYQWGGSCQSTGYTGCRFSAASPVAELKNIISIKSHMGTHLSVDRDGKLWGWGRDYGLITGVPSPRGQPRILNSPIQIPIPASVRSVVLASPYSFVIDQAGGLWLWGDEDRPEARPLGSRPIRVDPFVFWKVVGLPAVRSASTAFREPSYVVTQDDELWSWGSAKPTAFDVFGLQRPHAVPGLCPVASVSVEPGAVAALCRDGSVYGAGRGCLRCNPSGKSGKWELIQALNNVRSISIDATAGVIVLDESGRIYSGNFLRMSGPLNLDP